MKTDKKIEYIGYSILIGLCIGFIIIIIKRLLGVFTASLIMDIEPLSDIANPVLVSHGISIDSNYFPFAYLLVCWIPLLYMKETICVIYVVVTIFSLILLIRILRKNIENKSSWIFLFIIVFCSFPMLYLFERGNIEIFVFLFCILFYYFYKKKDYTMSAIMLSFAISIKLYPAMFALIFLRKKQYKAFAICIISTIAVTLLSYFLMLNLRGDYNVYLEGFKAFNDVHTNTHLFERSFRYNHTLYVGILYVLCYLFKMMINIEIFHKGYTIFIFVLTIALLVYLFRNKHLDDWKFMLIITLMMLSFPYISYDYTLVALSIPIVEFIISKKETKKESVLYIVLFGMLLAPLNFYEEEYTQYSLISLSVLLKPLIILVLTSLVIIKDSLYFKNMKLIEDKGYKNEDK